jgi:hypothetical protein
MKKTIRIGNASGFWGDDPTAIRRQLKSGKLDFLNADYLAEVSMSILSKQQSRDPQKGFVADFIEHMLLAADELAHCETRIITNAGGNNPIACAHALQSALQAKGIKKRIFAVTGDNIVARITALQQAEVSFQNMEDGRSFHNVAGAMATANVYTGSQPVAAALDAGADIVIAGRIADSALTIGPCMAAFHWSWQDYDKLAAAMIAGHIIECGSQATGGNFTDWEQITNWSNMAFPIIEMHADSSFHVTKATGTGGLLNQWTVKEQLVYEIADPAHYFGPDVVADISSILLRDDGPDKVLVQGAKGKPAPAHWKVSMSYRDGYKATGSVLVSGAAARQKVDVLKRALWSRFAIDFEKKSTQAIGYNACHQDLAPEHQPNEVLLQFTVFDHDHAKVELFSRFLSSLILSGPQGVAATGGRPKVQEVMRYWPALVPARLIPSEVAEVEKDGEVRPLPFRQQWHEADYAIAKPSEAETEKAGIDFINTEEPTRPVPLKKICLARSGDKGDMVNIGVLARNEKIYDFLLDRLTAEQIKIWFRSMCLGEVTRYELHNLLALNFTLEQALDGGGTYSGRADPQGKTFAAALLQLHIDVPQSVLNSLL